MRPLAAIYRDGLIRAMVPDRPAMIYRVHQPTVLDDYCNLLADCADAKELLRANGHGEPGMSVLELVQLLLKVPSKAPRARKRKGKR